MAYYTEEDVDEMIKQMTHGKTEIRYMIDASMDLSKMLIKNPMDYKSFGPYWWSIKEMIKKYNKTNGWFTGKDNDQTVKNRNWHKTLFRTIIAGLYYHGQMIEYKSEHSYTYKGVQIPYTLTDNDVGL